MHDETKANEFKENWMGYSRWGTERKGILYMESDRIEADSVAMT